jgi:hypothetical protein
VKFTSGFSGCDYRMLAVLLHQVFAAGTLVKSFDRLASPQHLTSQANAVRSRRE